MAIVFKQIFPFPVFDVQINTELKETMVLIFDCLQLFELTQTVVKIVFSFSFDVSKSTVRNTTPIMTSLA